MTSLLVADEHVCNLVFLSRTPSVGVHFLAEFIKQKRTPKPGVGARFAKSKFRKSRQTFSTKIRSSFTDLARFQIDRTIPFDRKAR